MPHGGVGRPCGYLSTVFHDPLLLSLLPQPSLSDLPAGSGSDLAPQATRVAPSRPLLPGDLHPPGSASRRRSSEPASPVLAALLQFGERLAAIGRRSSLPWW